MSDAATRARGFLEGQVALVEYDDAQKTISGIVRQLGEVMALLAELADEVESERSLRIQMGRELLVLTRAAGLPDPSVEDFGGIGKRTLKALITVDDAMIAALSEPIGGDL